MRYSKRLLKYAFILLPFILGVYGFQQIEGVNTTWALYYALRLYGINTDLDNINLYVEIARWLAPVATTSLVMYFFRESFIFVRNRIVALLKGSCSVYGDEIQCKTIEESFKGKMIVGHLKKPLRTTYHILLNVELGEALKFYESNRKNIIKRSNYLRNIPSVYINIDDGLRIESANSQIQYFSYLDNASFLYWQDYPGILGEKIGIIGQEKIIYSILEEALIYNVIDENQSIEYHLWNDGGRFQKLHTQLETVLRLTQDRLFWHEEDWLDDLFIITKLDRLILCGDNDENIRTILLLNEVCNMEGLKIFVYSKESIDYKSLTSCDSLQVFGSYKEVLSSEVIIGERLFEIAKSIHNIYNLTQEEPIEWQDLSSMLRLSNRVAASYYDRHIGWNNQHIDSVKKAQIEHLRWCRLYYIKNWKYGEKKDEKNRTHPCLVPFEQLNQDFIEIDQRISHEVELSINHL